MKSRQEKINGAKKKIVGGDEEGAKEQKRRKKIIKMSTDATKTVE